MSNNSTNSRWAWKDWTRAIIAGVLSWFLIAYLIEPALNRALTGTSSLFKWISDDGVASAIVYAKGGVECVLLKIAILLLILVGFVIVLLIITTTYYAVSAFWMRRTGRPFPGESSIHRFLTNPSPIKTKFALPLVWVSGVFIFVIIAQAGIPLAVGMSARIRFENAMARLAPNISQEEALALRSRWWAMRGNKDYELLADDVNRLAMKRRVFIGDPLSAEYTAIVNPSAQNK
jgi:hypothetical protein